MLYKRSQGRWKNVLSLLLLIWCVDRAGAPAQAQLSGGAPEEGPPSLATWLLGGSRGGLRRTPPQFRRPHLGVGTGSLRDEGGPSEPAETP
ncbi:unnamed protein product [Ascophyllum nodosum]